MDQIHAPEGMVAHWNELADDAVAADHSPGSGNEHKGPGASSRAMAIVHIAMHDALQSIERRYETYLPIEPASVDASPEAAVAQAARDTLVALYPSQSATFNAQLDSDLAEVPNGPAKTAGIAVGSKAARAILENRTNDGSEPEIQNQPYVYQNAPGQWQVDPLNPAQTAVGPYWGLVRPFALKSATQFRCPRPPALTSGAYAKAYAEVYRLGGDGEITPTERTEDQTLIGIFWAYDGTPKMGTPPRLCNQVLMKILTDQGVTDQGQLARVLALLNIAMADSGIAAWEAKFYYNLWRPVTAVRESDPGTGASGLGDENPRTPGDPNWTPYGAPLTNAFGPNFTPPFPAYPSGHAVFSGVTFEVLRQYFRKDKIPFTFISDELNGSTLDNHGEVRPLAPRSFASFSQAEEELGQSRIYLGIHYSFDKTRGIQMGRKIARWTFTHFLRPLRGKRSGR